MRANDFIKCFLCLFLCTAAAAYADSPVQDGLVYHLEADAITGLSNNDFVTAWPATVGDDPVFKGGSDPNFIADIANGKPAVNFDGGSFDPDGDGEQTGTTGAYITFPRRTDVRTVFWVLREDANAAQCGFMLGDSSSYDFHRAVTDESKNGAMWESGWTSAYIRDGVTAVNGDVVNGTYTDPPTQLSIVSLVTTGNVSADSFSHDRTVENRRREWDGALAELLIYNRALSDAEVNDVGHYLAVKYGLTTDYVEPTAYLYQYSPADASLRLGIDVAFDWEVKYAQGTPAYKFYISTDLAQVDPSATGYSPVTPIDLTDSSYQPASVLQTGQAYYWRVDVVDSTGTYQGQVMTFTTGCDIVSTYPADGATGMSTDITLSWAADNPSSTYVDGYEVYFGETLPATPSATVTDSSWNPGELADGTTYQWKVVSKHEGAVVFSSPVMSFTTGSLLGHWTLDDATCTDEIAGHNGTLVKTGTTEPTFGPGVAGNACWFDDTAVYSIPGETYWDSTHKAVTVSCFVRWNWEESTTNYNEWRSWVSRGTEGGTGGWAFRSYGQYGVSCFTMRGTTLPDEEAYYPYVDDGVWHHVVATYDGQRKIRYVDGEVVYTKPDSGVMTATTAPVAIGGILTDTGAFHSGFEGWVDDVKIYDRALSADQVQTLFVETGDVPRIPNPADTENGVFWQPVLSWTSGSNNVSLTLEFGLEADLSDATTFTLSGDVNEFDVYANLGYNLELYTIYYWRVKANLGDRIVEGPTWSFATQKLKPDLNNDKVVDNQDYARLADKWMNDSKSNLLADYAYADQTAWTANDPNAAEENNLYYYNDQWGPDDPWGWGELTIKTDPSPGDENYTPPSQTILWSYDKADGGSGTEAGMAWYLPEGQNHIDFSQYDSFSYWVKQTNCTGTADIRVRDAKGLIGAGTTQVIYHDWYDIGSYNDQWHQYKWTLTADQKANARDVVGFIFYRGGAGAGLASEEFGHFMLHSDNIDQPICWQTIPEDLNEDCIVDILDLKLFADDWLVDAN